VAPVASIEVTATLSPEQAAALAPRATALTSAATTRARLEGVWKWG